jgi:hypothetical protein
VRTIQHVALITMRFTALFALATAALVSATPVPEPNLICPKGIIPGGAPSVYVPFILATIFTTEPVLVGYIGSAHAVAERTDEFRGWNS